MPTEKLSILETFFSVQIFVPGQLHRPVPVRLDLPHDLRIADEVILNLLDDLCGLLRCARYHGDEAAGVLHADGDAAQRHQPGLAVAAGFDHHLCVAAPELPGCYLLGVKYGLGLFPFRHPRLSLPHPVVFDVRVQGGLGRLAGVVLDVLVVQNEPLFQAGVIIVQVILFPLGIVSVPFPGEDLFLRRFPGRILFLF